MITETRRMEEAVQERYSAGAKEKQAALCCPVSYDPALLAVIPQEIIEKDYGCGDPTPFLQPGDTVLDLGAGAGKVCFIAAQKVGPHGRVIGVDMNDDMIALARKHQPEVTRQIGHDNISFLKGKIQDLALDVALWDARLAESPIRSAREMRQVEEAMAAQKREHPLIADESIDCIVSNCVLNLVNEDEKRLLFRDMHRVLKRGGRVAVSDIVADEPVPDHLKSDPELWSGCLSGAMTEQGFLEALEEAGFYGLEIASRDETPWRTVEGIEFRSVVVTARKGKEGACWDHLQAVIYKGPFREVADDDGHTYARGARMAVCEKTFSILTRAPYAAHFYKVEPLSPVPPEEVRAFGCDTPQLRSPRATKGQGYDVTDEGKESCAPGTCC